MFRNVMLSIIEYMDSIFGLPISCENRHFNQSFTVQDLSRFAIPPLRLAVDLDSESAHHAYNDSHSSQPYCKDILYGNTCRRGMQMTTPSPPTD
ncbi:hypothetical protein P692DRAFT_20214435 [Suillus brevipes Sb2]|nr:hypothetical protein P692DRAFT_20214435 [Suillus brevipes Sb2]